MQLGRYAFWHHASVCFWERFSLSHFPDAFVPFAVTAVATARSRIGSFGSTSGVDTLGVATLGVEMGRISVFNSRFFLGLGSGASE